MKIGVFIGNYDPKIGGGFTFENTIIQAILQNKNDHEFYLISRKPIVNASVKSIVFKENLYWRLRRMLLGILDRSCYFFTGRNLPPAMTLLDLIVEESSLEMIWFPTPTFEPTSAPYIFTVWDLEHRIHPFFPEVSKSGWSWENRESHYRSIIPKSAIVLTGTEVGKKEIIKYYQACPENIGVVPLPTPSIDFQKCSKKSENIFKKELIEGDYLFYPAQFWPHKNHIAILLALKKLLIENIGMSVVFTGSDQGNMSYVKRIVKEFQLEKNVHFLGFVSQEELYLLYKKAFALVFPTFFGPDNLPPLEAFSLGCPVIASDVRGSKEQLGDAAILFDPKDDDSIVSAIKKLIQYPNLRKELVKKGHKRAELNDGKKYVEEVSSLISDFEKYRRCWPK